METDVASWYRHVVDESSPRMKYVKLEDLPKRLQDDRSKVVHLGQRKLLMAELDFLTDHVPAIGECTVVYAGAACGRHIAVFLELFPLVKWHLYDTNEFSRILVGNPNVTLHKEYLTERIAAGYSVHEDVLFISDIRTCMTKGKPITDADVSKDNRLNLSLVEAVDPMACMLKFRLPYAEGVTMLFEGEVRLQCWCDRESTEARLVCARPYVRKWYDHRAHEERMCFHNAKRPYPIPGCTVLASLAESAGVPDHYDMYRESTIVTKYMKRTGSTEARVYGAIAKVMGNRIR